MEEAPELVIKLPVKIRYAALEGFLREKLVGEEIRKEEKGESSSYAEILDVALDKSQEQGFDLAIDVNFRTLTTFFRNREGSILLDVALDFDAARQQVSVRDYQFNIDSRSWLLNNSLETLVNSFIYEKLRKKMKFDFRPLIEEQLLSLNRKLEQPLEAAEGIYLSGFITEFRIIEILPGEEVLLVFVEIQAKGLLEVRKIEF